jgi:hypothetical protein
VQLPARATAAACVARVDADLARVVDNLRHGGTIERDAGLRDELRALARVMESAAGNDEERALAAAWSDAGDRIVDSVGTLAHLLQKEKGLKAEG